VQRIVWGLELYARYVATVLILGASVALAVWLSTSIASWSHRRPGSSKQPLE
jgi:hypothetical protein